MDDLLALARSQMERVKALCLQAGLKFTVLPEEFIGLGVAVGFSQTQYVVLSVMGGGGEDGLMITSGLLNNIHHDRAGALEACNHFNMSNTAYPVFLHDAQVGWALVVQATLPIEVLLDVPAYFAAVVRGLPGIVDEYRQTIAERWDLGGQPWTWNEADHKSLLLRSMM